MARRQPGKSKGSVTAAADLAPENVISIRQEHIGITSRSAGGLENPAGNSALERRGIRQSQHDPGLLTDADQFHRRSGLQFERLVIRPDLVISERHVFQEEFSGLVALSMNRSIDEPDHRVLDRQSGMILHPAADCGASGHDQVDDAHLVGLNRAERAGPDPSGKRIDRFQAERTRRHPGKAEIALAVTEARREFMAVAFQTHLDNGQRALTVSGQDPAADGPCLAGSEQNIHPHQFSGIGQRRILEALQITGKGEEVDPAQGQIREKKISGTVSPHLMGLDFRTVLDPCLDLDSGQGSRGPGQQSPAGQGGTAAHDDVQLESLTVRSDRTAYLFDSAAQRILDADFEGIGQHPDEIELEPAIVISPGRSDRQAFKNPGIA